MKIRMHLSTWAPLLGLFMIRSSLANQYFIPSGSMEPTMQVGDHIFVNKMAYDLKVPFTNFTVIRTGEAERGDVIVFQDPRNPDIRLIKRLVGLPGDHVRVHDGVVTINGALAQTTLGGVTPVDQRIAQSAGPFVYNEQLGQKWHYVQRLPELARHEAQEFVVPTGQYFFLGDNRDNSADSRVWGFAPREALEGRAERVIYQVTWNGWIPHVAFNRSGARLDQI